MSALVQEHANSPGSVTSIPVGATQGWATPTLGNLLTAWVLMLSANQANVTTPAGWTRSPITLNHPTAALCLVMFYKISDGTESTITVAQTGAATGMRMICKEYSGNATASFVDTIPAASTAAAVTSIASPTAVTTNANDIVDTCLFVDGTNATFDNAWTNSFVRDEPGAGAGSHGTGAHRFVAATGSYTTTESWGATAKNAMSGIAAFKAAAASPPAGGAVALTGGNTVGVVETATNSGWSGSPTSYDYLWQTAAAADPTFASPITVRSNPGSGSATDTYTPVGTDDGRLLRCVVTANNAGGASTPAASGAVTVIFAAPVNTVAPVIAGTAIVGGVLTGTTGTWNPN